MHTITIERLKTLAGKAMHLVPEISKNPRLMVLGTRGVHLYSYLSLQPLWIRKAGITTVLDIGANTGQFASAITALLPEARIYCFEPVPTCYQRLTKKFSNNDRVQTFNVAVGDVPGRATFHQNGFTESSSLLEITSLHKESFPWTASTHAIDVEVLPLDSFSPQLNLNKRVLVKIDVQGYEDRVIRGGEKIIRQADYVFVETSFAPLYESQATFDAIYRTLVDFGFHFAGILDQMPDPRDGRALQADMVFIKDESS